MSHLSLVSLLKILQLKPVPRSEKAVSTSKAKGKFTNSTLIAGTQWSIQARLGPLFPWRPHFNLEKNVTNYVYQRCRGRERIKLSPLWRVFLIKSSFLTRSSHFQLNPVNFLERECCLGLYFWRHLLSWGQFNTVDLILRALRVIKNAPYPPSLESPSPSSDTTSLLK